LTDSPGMPEPRRPGPGRPERQADAKPAGVADPAKLEHDLRAMTRIVLRPIGSLVFYLNPPGAAAALGIFYVVICVECRVSISAVPARRDHRTMPPTRAEE
jgi:hypothetical protein